jgi:hypothetical protein
MLADIRAFCKENPAHELLNADDPGTHYTPWRLPRIGFCAFRNITTEFAAENVRRDARGEKMVEWDEQMKSWTITLGKVKHSLDSFREFPTDPLLWKSLHTGRGRLALAVSLRSGRDLSEVVASLPKPPPVIRDGLDSVEESNGVFDASDYRRSAKPQPTGLSSSSASKKGRRPGLLRRAARLLRAWFAG